MTVLLAVVGGVALLTVFRSGHWWLERRSARIRAEDLETDEFIRWIRDED